MQPRFLALLVIILACHVNGQSRFTNGLVAYFPLNGNALDESGNANHGVAYSVVPAVDRHGHPNGAIRFAGTADSHIKLTNASEFEFAGDFTISAWVRFDANSGTEGPRIFSTAGYEIGTQGTGSERPLFINNTGLGGIAVGVDSANTFPAATWIHIVGRRSGNTIVLFADGRKEGEVSGASSDYSRAFIPEIGGNSGAGFDAFGGRVDDVRVYDRALSDAEIRSLYALEQRQKPSLLITVRTVRVSMSVIPGKKYLLQNSDDMVVWSAVGASFEAEGSILERDVDVLDGGRFFRLDEIDLTNGLVAAYALNSNANDSSGRNNHGLLSSVSSTTNRFGVAGRAVQFGGSNSFVTIPENDSFDSQDYAVSLWFRADAPPSGAAFLLSKGRNNFELHLGSGLSGPTGIRFLPRKVGGSELFWDSPADTYQTNVWHHLVAIYQPSADSVRLFLDGQPLALAGADGALSAPDDNTNDARFGIRHDGSYPLKGALDDVRVYNRALTDAEVTALLYISD